MAAITVVGYLSLLNESSVVHPNTHVSLALLLVGTYLQQAMVSNGDHDPGLEERLAALSLSEAGAASLEVLRDLQDGHESLFEQYAKERRALDDKYAAQFAPIYSKRSEELRKGSLPGFWLTAFLNCEVVADNVTEKDQTALRFLRDVTAKEVSAEDAEQSPENGKLTAGSFTITFHFDENPFFENETLTKTYVMEEEDDAELDEAVGCSIRWKPGKDLTHRIMKKKIRGGRGGAGKVITKKEPCDTFFNFFSPPSPPGDGRDFDDDELDALEDVVSADFELGDTIRSDVVARAVLYFIDDVERDAEGEGGEEGEMDEGDDEAEDEESDDSQPPPPLPPAQNPEECKQQ